MTPCRDNPLGGAVGVTPPFRRAGHTLIEILLALGLSLVILTAVYAALDQHWRYAEAGQRQTERMQVTRALFERLSFDLRSVVFRPAARNAGSSTGIMGDGQRLVVQIEPADVDGFVRSRSVRWEMRPLQSRQPGESQTGQRQPDVDAARRPAMGLVRATHGVADTASPDDLWAEEVETIRFRFFARGSWFDQWDSAGRGELPQAVEITISFQRATTPARRNNDQQRAGQYRLIVPVPAAEA